MRVLVADKFENIGLEGLAAAGCEVVYKPDLKEDTLRHALSEDSPEALIVRSTAVTAEMLNGSLRLIVRAGAGYNTIDIEDAKQKNIQVANCPGKNAWAVAELAFGLILALDRRIPDNVAELRAGKWNKKGFSAARGLHGRTLGLIGMGSIGGIVAGLGRAFEMEVIVFSKHMSQQEAGAISVRLLASPVEVAANADVISVHSALTTNTKGMLGADFFQAMRTGAIFVNTSRAEIVDESALRAAVSEKGIRVGLDVFEGEPNTPAGDYSGWLQTCENVYGTHHIGASTEEAQEAVANETVRIVREFMKTGRAPNCVNCG